MCIEPGRQRKLSAKIVSAQASAVTRFQRPADRRTAAEDERDSRAACAGFGSDDLEKNYYYCRVGPVGGSDYWRDRSARDEKSQSNVVARMRNENASTGPSHSSASIMTLFKESELVFELDAIGPSLESLPTGHTTW